MSLNLIRCDRCGAPVDQAAWNASTPHECTCGAELYTKAFPMLTTPLTGGHVGSDLSGDDQSCCFFHPQKQASASCDTCGRFLCDLCDLPASTGHVCGQCFWRAMQTPGGTGQSSGAVESDDRLCPRRPTYDQAALSLALIPVTAPLGIVYALIHWNSPGSLLGVRKPLLAAAVVAGLASTAFWGYVAFRWLSEVLRG
jgi:hypothetical protein